MSGSREDHRRSESAEQRRQRLAAELRANLVKRKAQARARARSASGDAAAFSDGDGPEREDSNKSRQS